jgi:glycosyltransferase involved in cell wall biosynthesis
MINKPLKIAMVTTFYPPHNFGGDGIYVQRLTQALLNAGHHVEVFYNKEAYETLAKRTPPMSASHTQTPCTGLPRLSTLLIQQTGKPVLIKNQIKHFLKRDWDVIHFHNTSLLGAPAIFKYGDALKFYTTHEYWLLCPMHLLFKYDKAPCKKKNCISCSLIFKRPPQLWRYKKNWKTKLQHIDCFLSPSQFCSAKHLEEGIKQPIQHLPLFIPPVAVAEPKASLRPYFLYAGRLAKHKGVHEVLPFFLQHPDIDFVIAGSGPMRNQLIKMARGAANIIFKGLCSFVELQHLYRNAKALILPTLCYEVSGTVVLEAFAQKTPAIVRQHGGMLELVKDNNSGLYFSTHLEFERTIDVMLDQNKRDQMGENGRQAVLTHYSQKEHMSRYMQLIEKYRTSTK